jgi:hypothetical protein
MWTRGRFVNEYIPGLFTLAVDTYLETQKAHMWPDLVTRRESQKKKEEDAIRSGLGMPIEQPEGNTVGYDTQIAGAKQTWIHKVYALGVRLSEVSIEDNLYELKGGGNAEGLQDIFTDLGASMAENIEVMLARFFNSATATTYHTTRDGVALASASHKRLDGVTYSNKATAADLTYLTFWANLITAENQYNHRGYKIKKKVKNLWIPPQLERYAREIIQSPDRPDSGNRAISAYAKSGRQINIKAWPYMTDTDMWVLQTTGRGIIHFDRRKTRFAREKDFGTGDLMCKADQRFSDEVADERDFYFNVPA